MRVVVYGTGGMAREVIVLIEEINELRQQFQIIGLLDDSSEKHGSTVDGYPVLGGLAWAQNNPDVGYVIGIGSPSVRMRIVAALRQMGCKLFPVLVHPSAVVGKRVSLAEGTIICAQAVLTTNVCIEPHVIINPACTVSHDTVIKEFSILSLGTSIAGNVAVGLGCNLGANSAVIQGKALGGWCVIGAGGVVTTDIPANSTAVGVPAKVINTRPEGWQFE